MYAFKKETLKVIHVRLTLSYNMKLKEFGPPGRGARVPCAPLRSATGSTLQSKFQGIAPGGI